MTIGNRDIGVVLSALRQKRHYIAAANMFRVYWSPADAFHRHLLGRGTYPAVMELSTPAGPLSLTSYSHHDILTINEVFCRLDYPVHPHDKVIVDFGPLRNSRQSARTRGARQYCVLSLLGATFAPSEYEEERT